MFVSSGVSPLAVLRSLVVAVILGALLSGAGRLLLADRDRGGIFATLAILMFIVGADWRIALLIGVAIVLLFAERFLLTTARQIRWAFIARFARLLTTILVLAIAIQAVQAGTPGVVARAVTVEAPFHASPDAPPSPDAYPDIYVLLVDGHARPDVLEQDLGHDERPFVGGLEARGFSVARHSRTNYALTVQVLASMFNMRPLDQIESVRPLLAGTATRPPGAIIREAINDGPVLSVLDDHGYETIALASSYEEPAVRSVDRLVDTGQLNEFEVFLCRRTILRPLLATVAPDLVSSSYRARIDAEFEALASIAAEPRTAPRFVFGHIPSPHAPWVRRADGSPRSVPDVDQTFGETPASTGLDEAALTEAYIGQVAWVDERLIRAIDEIDTASATPPVIVVFGDHGTWIGADGGDIRLRFLQLFAARVPGRSSPFTDDIALVDTFPLLFNDLLGTSYPTHPEAPSFMFRGGNEYDHIAVPDPDAATVAR
jgi:hypothetical protein